LTDIVCQIPLATTKTRGTPPNGKHGDLFLLLGGILYQGAPNIPMKTLIIIKNKTNSISNLIKYLIKIYINFAKNWISKLSPNIPMNTLIKK